MKASGIWLIKIVDASWSLNWPSGANLLARKQHMYFFWCLCDYCVLVFLCYWESFNQTRLDSSPETDTVVGTVLYGFSHLAVPPAL